MMIRPDNSGILFGLGTESGDAVGKNAFAATSIVAAVPAGILAAMIVMEGFLKHVSDMGGLLLGLTGATLGVSAFVVLIPFGILIFGGSKKKRVVAVKAAKGKADAVVATEATDESEADVNVLQTSGEAMIVDADDDDAVVLDDEDIDDTTAFNTPASGPDLELSDEQEMVEADLTEFDEIDLISDEVILEDDEDDLPKKKRR